MKAEIFGLSAWGAVVPLPSIKFFAIYLIVPMSLIFRQAPAFRTLRIFLTMQSAQHLTEVVYALFYYILVLPCTVLNLAT